MHIEAVLFDLDGTITEPLLDFSQIRREMGLSPDSPSVLEAIQTLSPEAAARANEILNRHEEHAARHSTLQPGAKALVSKLRKRGIRLGILTRNCRRWTEHVLQKHKLVFDGIITREDGPAKPDGFGVLELCRRFGADPARTMVVGDYLHDLLAARNTGATAILLKNQPKAEDYAKYADFCISHLDEVCQILDNHQKP